MDYSRWGEALIIPDDLQQAFVQNQMAAKSFERLSNSRKKEILFKIVSAKRPQTKANRIEKIIYSLTSLNEREFGVRS